jgi:ABC-type uncharacterized transport system auxiliary subunit
MAAAGLAGCSVLPDRPYQEVRRYALAPSRPGGAAIARRGAPVLLLRSVRAAPGLDQRGLRVLGPGGRITAAFWDEWAAPPAELAELALRRWLGDSGLFAAVVPPGSRLGADLVMEAELLRLDADPAAGEARAALAVLLLADAARDAVGPTRILGQAQPVGRAPLAGGAGPGDQAAAMEAAFAAALAVLEAALRPMLADRAAARR